MFAYLSSKLVEKFFPCFTAFMARRRDAQLAARVARLHKVRFVRPRLEDLEERIVPDAYTWIGPSGGSWGVAANWNNDTIGGGGVPGSSDTATIDGGYCVVSKDQTVAGLSVVQGGRLDIDGKLSATTTNVDLFSILNVANGGEFDVQSSADLGGGGTLSGKVDTSGSTIFEPNSYMILGNGVSLIGPGAYYIYGPLTCDADLTQTTLMVLDGNGSYGSGSLTGSGSLNEGSEFDWDGGVLGLDGGETFIASSDLKMQGADNKELSTGTLLDECNGSEIGGTGSLTIDDGATFDNMGNPMAALSIPVITTQGSGLFVNEANGWLTAQGSVLIVGNFINDGVLHVDGASSLELENAGPSTSIALNGTLQLDGNLILAGDITSSNLVELPGSGSLTIGDAANGINGSLDLAGGATFIVPLEVTNYGTLTSEGQVSITSRLMLDFSATTSLASFKMSPSATLAEQSDGPGQVGTATLNVLGEADLSGTMELDFISGYTPKSGDSFLVVKAGSIYAHFDTVSHGMTASYSPTTASLTEN